MKKLLFFCICIGLLGLPINEALGGSCTIIGGKKTPALMKIHEETPSADLGRLIWEGTLKKDQRMAIIHPGYRIRYMFRSSIGVAWSVHKGILCNNHEELILP